MSKSIPKSEQRANVIYDYIRYRFKNPKLLEQAFTTPSAIHHKLTNLKESYQKLEFLGDSILKTVITDLIYHLLPDAKEGELSKKRSELEKNKALHKISGKLKLTEYVIKKDSDKYNTKLDADLIESIIGAIFLDSNDYKITKYYTLNLIRENILIDFEAALIYEYLGLLGSELNIQHEVERSSEMKIHEQKYFSQTPCPQENGSSNFTPNGSSFEENIHNNQRLGNPIMPKNSFYSDQIAIQTEKKISLATNVKVINLEDELSMQTQSSKQGSYLTGKRTDELTKNTPDKRFNAFDSYYQRLNAENAKNKEIEMELDDIDQPKTPYRLNTYSKGENKADKYFNINYPDSPSD